MNPERARFTRRFGQVLGGQAPPPDLMTRREMVDEDLDARPSPATPRQHVVLGEAVRRRAEGLLRGFDRTVEILEMLSVPGAVILVLGAAASAAGYLDRVAITLGVVRAVEGVIF